MNYSKYLQYLIKVGVVLAGWLLSAYDAPFPIIQSKRCMRIPSSADPVNKIRKDTAISRQKNCDDSFIFFPHVAAPPAFMRDTSFFVSTIQGKYLGIVLEMFLKY